MDTTTNTQELNRIISKLHTERVRYDCIETLGKVNEKEATLGTCERDVPKPNKSL